MTKRALPAAILGLCLGLTGLFGLLLQALTTLAQVPASSPALRALAAALHAPCMLLIVAYVLLGLWSGGLMADLHCVTKRPLLSAGAMAVMNVGGVAVRLLGWAAVGKTLYWLGVALHILLQPLTLHHLLRSRPSFEQFKITWVVALVGIAAAAQPDCGGSDVWQLFTIILAVVYAVVLTPGIFGAAFQYYRKLEGPKATAELPHLVVLIAPYALVLSTWIATSPRLLSASTTEAVTLCFAVGTAAAIGAVLAQLPRLARLPLTASSASYTFPLVTLGVSLVRWFAQGNNGVQRQLTNAEIVLCWTITVVTALPTFFAIFSTATLAVRGTLLMPVQRDGGKAAVLVTEENRKVARCTSEENLTTLSEA